MTAFKNSFLDEISFKIINENKAEDLKDVTIVLPSRRAGIYLKKAFSNQLKKTFFLPKITTINELIIQLSGCEIINGFEAELELYSCYKNISDNPEPLDKFLNIAPLIINDFNLIDKYLLKADQLLFDLRSIKEIENWSLNDTNLTENQNNFVEFWIQLGQLYQVFHDHLKQINFATEGHAYRKAYTEIDEKAINLKHPIYFVGLNALCKAEEEIIQYLIKKKNASIHFDGDAYYTNNPEQEAGYFFRKFSFFNTQNNPNNFLSNKKNITVYEAKTDIDQIHIASSILQKENLDLNSTAIYLIDENLLTPFTHNVPENINALNVSMGYSIKNTYCFAFIKLILSSLDDKNEKNSWRDNNINFDLLLEILSLPIFNDIIPKNFQSSEYWKKIKDKNIKFINLKSFINEFKINSEILSFHELRTINDPILFSHKLIEYFSLLKDKINNIVEKTSIALVIENAKKIHNYISNYSEKESINNSIVIRSLIKQLSILKIPFYGEPLKGLQIMGFLESRVLDFKNVILLSCNESLLPGSEFDNSLFPYDVKKHYKIPGIMEKDAIFSYYFYRAIQRSENIFLIYSTNEKSKIGSSEPSRYIHQLEKEIINENSIQFKKKFFRSETNEKTKSIISNNQNTLLKINDFFLNGVSPSSINCFLKCPKDFYYKYILKVSEEVIVEDTIENNTWGTIVHNTLQELFKDLGLITVQKIQSFKKDYFHILDSEFKKTFPDNRYKEGKNALLFHQASKCINAYLNNEINNIKKSGEFEVIGVEKRLEHHLNYAFENENIQIKIKGSIDRIDRTKKGIRIVDYKSGYIQDKDLKISSYKAMKNNSYALQLMLYAYLYHFNYVNNQKIYSSIISLKNPRSNYIYLNNKSNKTIEKNMFLDFETFLKTEFLEKVLDRKLEFTHNKSSKYCMMC